MYAKSLIFVTLLSGANILGAPLVPTSTDAGRGDHHAVSVNCVGKDGENTCSPSQSAAINEALVSVLPVVEGKPDWTVDRQNDGRVESLKIEGPNAPGEKDQGEAGTLGFWDWFGTWRYDYAWGIGPKR